MKKVIALVTLLSLAVAFSCVVFAAGDGAYEYTTSKSATKSTNNVTVKVTGVEMANPEGSYVMEQGIQFLVSDINIIYTVSVVNNNSTSMYLNHIWFTPTFDESVRNAIPTSIDNFSSDLFGTIDSTSGGCTVNADADWTFLGNICVPANTSMTAVFVVKMSAYRNTTSSSTGSWSAAALSSISISNFTATSTDFCPQGSHEDLLISLEALRTFLTGNSGVPAINSTLSAISSKLIDVYSSVDDIERLLTWVGTYTSIGIGNRSNGTFSMTGMKVVIRNFGSVPITDFEILPPNVVASDVLYRHPIMISIESSFTEDKTISGSFVINDFIASSGISFDMPQITGQEITQCGLAEQSGYIDAYIRYTDNVIRAGKNYYCIWIDVYSRSSYIPINGDFTVTLVTTDYQSDLSSSADDLKTQSDNIHTQESAYFQQNSQAIAQTGLSNYRFDSTQGGGIAAVSNDFTTIFNALGSWNTIYIFSLTLGLALTIIRHSPNAISRKIRNKMSE